MASNRRGKAQTEKQQTRAAWARMALERAQAIDLLRQIKRHLDLGGQIWPSNACHDDVNTLLARLDK
jgi:hypothetical protein